MKGKINELPNIDTSRYSIDENGNVLRDKRMKTKREVLEEVAKNGTCKNIKCNECPYDSIRCHDIFFRIGAMAILRMFKENKKPLVANKEVKENIKKARKRLFNILTEYEIGNYDNNTHQFYEDVYNVHNELMELAE